MTNRIYLWDNLKFFAILCILLLHSVIPCRLGFVRYIETFINLYPMTMFAIISGYWYKERTISQLAIMYLWPCFLFSVINNICGWLSYYPDYIYNFSYKAGFLMWYLLALFVFSLLSKVYYKRNSSATIFFLIVFFVAVAIGFTTIDNRYFDIQRISSMLPCFVFGLVLKEKFGDNIEVEEGPRKRICVGIIVFCLVLNLALNFFCPESMKYDATYLYYGHSVHGAMVKWLMMFLRIIACTCMIMVFPNKTFWYTKYGTRTMNAYLLHGIPILLINYGIFFNWRYEWFGIVAYYICLPLLYTLLLSTPVAKFMKKVLLSDYLKKLKQRSIN